MRYLLCVLLTVVSGFGCSAYKSNLANCESSRERLLVEIETLKEDNRKLAIEQRSTTHRLAEAEKQLARREFEPYAETAEVLPTPGVLPNARSNPMTDVPSQPGPAPFQRDAPPIQTVPPTSSHGWRSK